MNQLENCQARYGSNTWMGRTRTDGPDEFEPSKFDCIYKDGTPIFNDGTPIIIKVESQGPQNIQLSVKPCNKVSNNSERVQVVGSWVIGTKVKISYGLFLHLKLHLFPYPSI